MRTIFKILISLIISLGLFIVLIFLSLSGYKSFIESELYQPVVIKAINENLNKIASVTEIWYSENKKLFSAFLKRPPVKNSFEQEQTYADIKMRENAAVDLISSVTGLSGIRIIDTTNQKIHFSTISSDIFSRSESMISYKKYGTNKEDIPIEFLIGYDWNEIKITADPKSNLFLYSIPFHDIYDTYRGIAVFYVSEKALLKKLISEKKLSLTDTMNLITDTDHSALGILMGAPYSDLEELKPLILSNWKTKLADFNFISLDNKKEWILISAKCPLGYVGQICEKNIFLFPSYVKYFLTVIAVITVFLVTFLLLNIKQDKLAAVQTKIQKLHLAILKNYIKHSGSKTNNALKQELEYRRHDANAEIKRRLGKRFLKKNEKQVDDFLQTSWNKIFAAISGKIITSENNAEAGQNMSSASQEELTTLLRTLIAEVKSAPKSSATVTAVSANESAEDLEELSIDESAEVPEELPADESAEALEELPGDDAVEEPETLQGDDLIEELEELPIDESAEVPEELSGDINIDDPMKLLEESGYTISGLDFSDLNIPLSELKDAEAEEVAYIDDNYDFQKSLWGKYSESPLEGILDSAGGIEIVPLLNLDDEQTIINEDGIFVIKKTNGAEPENKDFKALVDSILK